MTNFQSRFFIYFRIVFISFLIFFIGQNQAQAHHRFQTLGVPGVFGGIVTTTEPLAAQAGAEMLRTGGNAFDAAAAVSFALNVVEPQSSGIGGGGFMMIYHAKSRKTFIVESREKAPAAVTPDMFVSQPSFSTRASSGYAVGVPGTLKGVATALERWGSKTLAQTLAPAIDLAENGFRASARLAEGVLSSRLTYEPGNPAYDEARNIFVPGGVPIVAGDLVIQSDLANTFKLIAAQGIDVFYDGPISQAIVDTQLATRSTNPDGVGRMTLQDLLDYEVVIRKPVYGDYRGFEIAGMPPPSSGGLTVIQILKLLERFPMGDESQGFGLGDTRTLNVMIEAMRLAFADRAVWMGDEDFVPVPKAGLLNDDYIAIRSALIDPDSRQADVVADDPRPFDPDYNQQVAENLLASNLPDEEGVNTTHFTIADQWGNIVTYTSTIESSWGTGLMVPGYGFMLNNELTDFNRVPTANPDPANFNPGANDLAPGKRPRSSMAPTIIFSRGKPVAAFGSPGGSTIIDTVANIAINLIDHKMPIQEAIDAPRIAQTSANGSTRRELGFDDDVLDELIALGHTFREPLVPGIVGNAIGAVQAVVLDKPRYSRYSYRSKREYIGGADKRRIGSVVSVRCEDIEMPHYFPYWYRYRSQCRLAY